MSFDIVHVSSVHGWKDTRIFLKMCHSLAASGLKVALVVLNPELKEGYTETHEGVIVYQLPGADISGRLRRATIGAIRVMRFAISLKTDAIQIHDPELIPSLLAARLTGHKTIFDAHEDFIAQNDSRPWARGWKRYPISTIAKILKALSKLAATHIIVATRAIANGYPEHKVSVINNYPIIGELSAPVGALPIEQRAKRGIYVGGMADIRGLSEVIKAINLVDDIEGLDLVGPIQGQAFENQLKALPGWQKVKYHGVCSRNKVAKLMSGARFGVVTFHPLPNHIDAQPNKLFEYLSAGLPVLHSNFQLWCRITEPAGAGQAVDPLDPVDIASGISKILKLTEDSSLSARAYDLISSSYSWNAEKEIYIDLVKSIIDGNKKENN